MPLDLTKNKTDNSVYELSSPYKFKGGESSCVWTILFGDALNEGAVGKLREKLLCMNGKLRVVIVLEEEWNEKSRQAGH